MHLSIKRIKVLRFKSDASTICRLICIIGRCIAIVLIAFFSINENVQTFLHLHLLRKRTGNWVYIKSCKPF